MLGLGSLKETLFHMDKHIYIYLYKIHGRPHVEYANSVWHPFKKGDIEDIEKKTQPRASKLVISSKLSSYT